MREDFESFSTVLCALFKEPLAIQYPIDTFFNESDDILFEVKGDNPVHLTGNYVEVLSKTEGLSDKAFPVKQLENRISFQDSKLECGRKVQLGDTVSIHYIYRELDGFLIEENTRAYLLVFKVKRKCNRDDYLNDKEESCWDFGDIGLCIIGMAVNGVRRGCTFPYAT